MVWYFILVAFRSILHLSPNLLCITGSDLYKLHGQPPSSTGQQRHFQEIGQQGK